MYTNFQEFQPYQRVEFTDLDGDNDATRNLVGEAIAAFTGLDNGLPTPGLNVAPLAIVSNLSTLTLTVGGAGQSVFVQQRYADYCPAVTLTVPPNTTGQVRYDIIAIQYTQVEVNPHGAVFNLPSGGIESGTVYQFAEGITLQYVTGGSASFPSPPSGFVTFANVLTPNGATYSGQCQIAIVFHPLTDGFNGGDGAGATQLAVDFVPAPSGSTATAQFVDARAFPVGVSATIANGTLTPFEGQVTAVAGNYVTLETIVQGSVSPLLAGSVVTFGGPPGPPGSGVDMLSELIDVDHSTEALGWVLSYAGAHDYIPNIVQEATYQGTDYNPAPALENAPTVGNLLIARIASATASANIVDFPPWTLLGSYGSSSGGEGSNVAVYWKISTGSADQSFAVSQNHAYGISIVLQEIADAGNPTSFNSHYYSADTQTIDVPDNALVFAVWSQDSTATAGGAQPGWTIDLDAVLGIHSSGAFQHILETSATPVFGSSNNGGVNAIFYVPGAAGTAPPYVFIPPPSGSGGGGVTSVEPFGGTEITGAVVFVPSGAAQISQSGQEIIIYAPSGGGGGGVTAVTASSPLASSGGDTPNITLTTPLPIADGGTGTASPGDSPGSGIGISGSWPNETIANTGMLSLAPSGGAALTGAVVLVPSGGTILSESGQEIIIYSPPSGGGGGVSSLAPSGGTGITGAVILVPSGGTILSQSGQEIIVYSPSGGTSGATKLSQLTDVDTSTEEIGYVLTYNPTTEFVPARVQAITGESPTGYTLTLTLANAPQVGNLLVARMTSGTTSNDVITTPTGWTLAHQYSPGAISGQTFVFTKISAGSADQSAAFAPTGSVNVVGIMEEWGNAGTPTGFADANSSTDSASINVPSNAVALAMFACELGVTVGGGAGAGWSVDYEFLYPINASQTPSFQAQSRYFASGLSSQYAASNVGLVGGASSIFYIPGAAGSGTPYEFLPIPSGATGVTSLAPSGSTALTGAVLLIPSGGTQLAESGNGIIIYSPPSGGGGVSSLAAPSGGTALTGAIVLIPSGGTVLSESGQRIIIYSPPSGGGGGGVSYPLPVPSGGTGTSTPSLSSGAGITITGSWPDQTIATSGGGAGIPFVVVQSAPNSSAAGTTTTTVSITFPQTATSGNTIVVIVAAGAGAYTTPTGYSALFTAQASTSLGLGAYIKTAAGTENSFSLTQGSASSFRVMFFEIQGTHSVDHAAVQNNSGTPTTITPPALTPSSGAMVFCAAAFYTADTHTMALGKFPPLGWLDYSFGPINSNDALTLGVLNGQGAGAALALPTIYLCQGTGAGVPSCSFSIL